MNVTPLQPADAEAFARMRCELYTTDDASEVREEALAFLRTGEFAGLPGAVFVARGANGELAGFVEVAEHPHVVGCRATPVCHIEGIYTAPGSRGTGVGASLMRACAEWARSRGVLELTSDAEIDNHASALFHKALGFEETETVRFFRLGLETPSTPEGNTPCASP